MKRILFAILIVVAAAAPAAAQVSTSAVRAQAGTGTTRPAQDRVGLVLFGNVDFLSIAASKTFDAVFDTSNATGIGAGVDVVNLWKHAFVRVQATKASFTGQRVVVVNGTVYKLGTELTADMTPTELGAGWRFESRGTKYQITPYLGASAVFLGYKETSMFAEPAENVSETYKGFGVFGGVDFRVFRQVLVGGEGQYRVINSTPAENSAAANFNEKNLGGLVLRLKVGVRF
jgi:hypothetical protein